MPFSVNYYLGIGKYIQLYGREDSEPNSFELLITQHRFDTRRLLIFVVFSLKCLQNGMSAENRNCSNEQLDILFSGSFAPTFLGLAHSSLGVVQPGRVKYRAWLPSATSLK